MWRVYVAIAIFVIVGGGLWHYRHVVAENRELKTSLRTANSTITAMDNAAKAKAAIYETERTRLDEIDNAPSADDGAVAPVLRRTLDGMR